MVDRNCNWNLGLWSLIHDWRPQWQSLQEKQSLLKSHLLWQHLISRPSSEKEEQQPENNSFQDAKPTKVKTCPSRWTPATWMPDPCYLINPTHQTPLPSPSSSPQWLCLTRLPSYSLPASLPSRESSQRTLHLQAGRDISLNYPSSDPMLSKEDSHPGFQLYCRKCHPWHQTNWRDQPKQEPDRLSAQCVELLSRPLRRKLEIGAYWLISRLLHTLWNLTPFKTITVAYTANHQTLTPFKTPVTYNQIDLFKDPMFICGTEPLHIDSFQDPSDLSSNWLISIPYVHIQHKTVQIDSFEDPYIGLHSVFILHGGNS